MCERQGNDADVALWSPRRVPEVLREDDPDGRLAASVTPALRHLSCQDPTTEAEWDDCRRRPSSDVSVALFCGRQVLGCPQLSFQLHHGIHQVGCTWFRVQLLRWQDLGCPQFGISVLHGQSRVRAQLGVPLLHDIGIVFPVRYSAAPVPPPPTFCLSPSMGCDISVSIATRCGLYGPEIKSRWGSRFSLPVQPGFGAHPASYNGVTVIPGGAAAGAWH